MAILAESKLCGLPVIAGGGIAGLTTALSLGRPCILVCSWKLGRENASALAQGGMAAAIGPHDSVAHHVTDTINAGAGLCDSRAVRAIIGDGPKAVEMLSNWGVAFDRGADGSFDLHQEAAHQCPRIVHARGDGSGAAIVEALVDRVRACSRIYVLENMALTALHLDDTRLGGVWLGNELFIPTRCCILAVGGAGGLYRLTTNPKANSGRGLAVAARAGAQLIDMEFVQFHPTALDLPAASGQSFLVSEAVRGCGGILLDAQGKQFVDELAPRDVVARAVAAARAQGGRVFLDVRNVHDGHFAQGFPAIAKACRAAGINPPADLIPVAPAVHYHMGGVATDISGRTSLEGLWACGEVACTGLHGANRLASNSLLEGFVMGRRVAADVDQCTFVSPRATLPVAPARFSAHDIGSFMEEDVGLIRDAPRLTRVFEQLARQSSADDHALIGALIAWAALQRKESRGSHSRIDFPEEKAPHRLDFSISEVPLAH